MYVYLKSCAAAFFELLVSDTIPSEDRISKAAKGKQFTSDYDLHCYKIVFQLAVKQENCICILPVTCETDLINEREYQSTIMRTASYVYVDLMSFRKNSNKRRQTKKFANRENGYVND